MKQLILMLTIIAATVIGYQATHPLIDVYVIDDTQHTYGYWERGIDAWYHRTQPAMTITLPIEDNGNYSGNPSSYKLFRYLWKCRSHPEYFTPWGYQTYINPSTKEENVS